MQFTSLTELESYIENSTNDGEIYIDNDRRQLIIVEPCEYNTTKMEIDDFDTDINKMLHTNFTFIDADCSCMLYEARKDKFYYLFEDLIASGRLFYSVD